MADTVLIVDDDTDVIFTLRYLLEEAQYHVLSATCPETAIALLQQNTIDCILLDMNFKFDTTSGKEGLELLKSVRKLDQQVPIIMLTGWATVELAVSTLKSGAQDFIQKPWNDDALLRTISNNIKLAKANYHLLRLSGENKLLVNEQDEQFFTPVSTAMLAFQNQLLEYAKSDMNILLTGENGTGKSYYAKLIHQHSNRADKPFISVNMGAIPESLFESEMFGHVKGAFTDAKSQRLGRIALAQNGSLFLDEITNLPINQQVKLLNVLEEGKYEPVGSQKTHQLAARIISATNSNLIQVIQQKQFRADLYYRLNTVTLQVPPLRERKDDILPMCEAMLALYARKYHKPIVTIAACAKKSLSNYTWPGNVRELKHLMERMVFVIKSTQLTALDLGISLESQALKQPELVAEVAFGTLDQIERKMLEERLSHFKGNIGETCQSLGISRSGWYRRVDKFNL